MSSISAALDGARKQRARVLLVALLSSLGAIGCKSARATEHDCDRILDKVVELELHERGFRDPVLLQRKRDEFHRRLRSELIECEGKSMRADAIGCVERATTTEEISHRCLR